MEELESLECKSTSIEKEMKEIARERLVLDKEVLDQVEEVLAEEKIKMKNMMVVLSIISAVSVVSMAILYFK